MHDQAARRIYGRNFAAKEHTCIFFLRPKLPWILCFLNPLIISYHSPHIKVNSGLSYFNSNNSWIQSLAAPGNYGGTSVFTPDKGRICHYGLILPRSSCFYKEIRYILFFVAHIVICRRPYINSIIDIRVVAWRALWRHHNKQHGGIQTPQLNKC